MTYSKLKPDYYKDVTRLTRIKIDIYDDFIQKLTIKFGDELFPGLDLLNFYNLLEENEMLIEELYKNENKVSEYD